MSSRSFSGSGFWAVICVLFMTAACSTALQDAKLSLVQGQEYSRSFLNEQAVSSFKASRNFAEKSIAKNPTSQAYVVKGMAELNLELWEEAVRSFRTAFSLGFDKGEEWAEEVSLYGLGLSMEKLGLEHFALEVFKYLLAKSRMRSISVLAAREYSFLHLKRAQEESGEKREKLLRALLKKIDSLAQKDLSCGYYHYLLSQVYGHLAEYRLSFEEAVVARELDLPKIEIFRDNDLQIVFCYQKLKQDLEEEAWNEFFTVYEGWIQRWGWPGPDIPDWKR